jgi:site-specific DNA-adenine methylase
MHYNKHNITGKATQLHGIHEHVDRTIHQILEPQFGSTAVFTNNFKHLMMSSAG